MLDQRQGVPPQQQFVPAGAASQRGPIVQAGNAAKKSKAPVAIAFICAAVVLVVAAAVFLTLFTGSPANADFIKIGSDEVPSVKYIIGEARVVTGERKSTEDGVSKRVIAYEAPKNQREDMLLYANALSGNYGFWYYETDEGDFAGSRGVDLRLVKESVEEDHIVIVRLDYDLDGYTVTLSRMRGTLTVKR